MKFHPEAKWIDWVDQLSFNDFVVIDQFLPATLYSKIRKFLIDKLEQDAFDRAGIGSSVNNLLNSGIRGDFTCWLEKHRDLELQEAFEVIEETLFVLNRFCFLSLSGYEFHLAYYPEGTFYKKHVDQFRERSNRMISMIIYLNDGWQAGDGGELQIFRNGEALKIDPLANRCVLFKSADVPHEVLQTNVGRFSLTGWMLYQPQDVGYLLG